MPPQLDMTISSMPKNFFMPSCFVTNPCWRRCKNGFTLRRIVFSAQRQLCRLSFHLLSLRVLLQDSQSSDSSQIFVPWQRLSPPYPVHGSPNSVFQWHCCNTGSLAKLSLSSSQVAFELASLFLISSIRSFFNPILNPPFLFFPSPRISSKSLTNLRNASPLFQYK